MQFYDNALTIGTLTVANLVKLEHTQTTMTAGHLHLALNHFPIAFAVLGMVLLILESILKKPSIGTFARAIWVAAATTGLAAFFSGEGAEDLLEASNLKDGHWIHEHEELAEKAFALLEATGALALLTLCFERSAQLRTWIRPVRLLTLLLALLTTGFLLQTARLGGLIRHTEIRDSVTLDSEQSPRP